MTNDYDRLAAAYTVSNETDMYNAYSERPAMPGLAGDVTATVAGIAGLV